MGNPTQLAENDLKIWQYIWQKYELIFRAYIFMTIAVKRNFDTNMVSTLIPYLNFMIMGT